MKRTFAKVFLFVVGVVSIFAAVGRLVPQVEEHPPVKQAVTPQSTPEELASMGREILHSSGCLICHKDSETGNERGPDLRQAAGKASTRKPGMGAEEYLLESITEPDVFIVSGYPKMMPSALGPPANLSKAEIKAVVAYLQSLGGGEPTVKVLAEDVAAAKAKGPVNLGKALMGKHGCTACHKVEGEGGEIGPELTKVATGHEPADIMKKIIDPKTWIAPGFEGGIMPEGMGDSIPESERREIVAYLAKLSGKQYGAAAAGADTGADSAASLWSHEGVRLGLVIAVFNVVMLLALAMARRNKKAEGES